MIKKYFVFLVIVLLVGTTTAHAWMCPECNNEMNSKFCTECGSKQPENTCLSCGISFGNMSPKFCFNCGAQVTTKANTVENKKLPENMIIDEAQWEAWKASRKCTLYLFMGACEEAGFTYSLPGGQNKSTHKTCRFVFQGGTKDGVSLKNVEMYYYVENQEIIYLGLWTSDITIFESADFKEACVRLMLGYNIHYDSKAEKAVLNLSRERANEVVAYCLDNIEHCLVDNMRIRVIRDQEDDYYSFHMEY